MCLAAGVKATTLVLLKAGARPDRADNAGKTGLSIAEEEGHHKLVDLLLEWAPARPPTPEPEAHPIEPDIGAQQAATRHSQPVTVWNVAWVFMRKRAV